MLGQHFQRRSYNKGRLSTEFQEGDLVLLNPHSLSLLRNETGRGRKLLMKYDGPFEIIQKLNAVSIANASILQNSPRIKYRTSGEIPTFTYRIW